MPAHLNSKVDEIMVTLNGMDFMPIRRYLLERGGYDGQEEFVDGALREYQRFIAISAVYATPEQPTIMSNVVDPVWHAHLLFTKHYTRMCQDIAGGYLHHDPAFPEELDQLEEGYNQTLALYERHFGAPPKQYWPDFAQICGLSGCSCSGPGNE